MLRQVVDNLSLAALALAELETSTAEFKSQRNIDGISLLKKRIELEIEAEQSTLSNDDKNCFPLKIRCCGGCGFSTTLQVKSSDSIENVKYKMWQKQSIPPHQQRLIHGELELGDDRTLNDYNINTESELRMVLHLRGYNTDWKLSYQQLGLLCLDLAELNAIAFKFQRNVDGITELKIRIETEMSVIQSKMEFKINSESTQEQEK